MLLSRYWGCCPRGGPYSVGFLQFVPLFGLFLFVILAADSDFGGVFSPGGDI